MAYAAYEFSLMERLEDGSTQGDHVKSYVRQTRGQYPPGWEPVVCPCELTYLWNYWCSMHARRGSTGFGPATITDQAILAWQERRGVVLEPFEQEALDALEMMYFISQPKPKASK